MEIFTIVTVWILTVVSLLVGYLIGSQKGLKDLQKSVHANIQSIKQNLTPVGPVNRPPPETVNQWQDKRRVDEDEAFKASFLKDHPEMTTVFEK
jgi:hypothetical protein